MVVASWVNQVAMGMSCPFLYEKFFEMALVKIYVINLPSYEWMTQYANLDNHASVC